MVIMHGHRITYEYWWKEIIKFYHYLPLYLSLATTMANYVVFWRHRSGNVMTKTNYVVFSLIVFFFVIKFLSISYNSISNKNLSRFAYIEFADDASVEAAVALHESLFKGRQIKVSEWSWFNSYIIYFIVIVAFSVIFAIYSWSWWQIFSDLINRRNEWNEVMVQVVAKIMSVV